ncbi:glycosyltransferase [Streptomyces sp. p1417]|uniref:Glycosyltransferase n=1 Tax=Streptomyces typhae TaxID=2681492 RepID=A0A6L6X3Q9_9ACTN|nr:glycosyltransferase [Streptomyces typhae]
MTVSAAPPRARPAALTVIVPTRNEAHNIAPLLDRLDAAVPPGLAAEVLFVDDSCDNTPEVIEEMTARCRLRVTVHHRPRPEGGLGGAVHEGIRRTAAPWIVVMDADLQHPPELAHRLALHGQESGADLVVASRYARGGSRAGLAGGYRAAVSRSSTALTKALFPRALRGISDPMSGFFAVRRDMLTRRPGSGAVLRPLGYKILLELAVRRPPRTVAELPYTFAERHAGRSKSSLREGTRFLRHLLVLRTTSIPRPPRLPRLPFLPFLRFAGRPRALRAAGLPARVTALGLIGLSGFLPNLALLALLTAVTPLHHLAAETLATQAAVLWNFLLAETLLPPPEPSRRRRSGRLAVFAALSNADLAARLPLTALLIAGTGWHPVPATAVLLVLFVATRLLLLERLLYRRT